MTGDSHRSGQDQPGNDQPGNGSSPDDIPVDPFAEFIDDYFVECDEHLAVARRSLLALESSLANPQLDSSLLDDLFRCFHSIKGLSAMVGLREAELLAHEMESYLSLLRKGAVRLTGEGLETLIVGVNSLEQIIGARRTRSAPPAIGELLSRFSGLGSQTESPTANIPTPTAVHQDQLDPEKRRLLEAALATGAKPLWFTFAPSAALAERGINVNSVRQRLEGIGRLIDATPVVIEKGKIAFTFLIACPAIEPEFSTWTADGLTFVPCDHASQPQSSAENGKTVAAPSVAAGSSAAITNVVRVELSRLDSLMRMVGELVISRARLNASLERTESLLPAGEWRSLQETNQALERQLRDLREGIMHVRMVPIRDVFARMRFVVRDLTREFQKKVVLSLHGEETEIDKFIVERIMDPLLHLVRNAVSHGLETAEERVAQGKTPDGHLELRAWATGETIRIEVADDGRGIDAERTVARAREAGFVGPGTASDDVLLDVICSPGFSTREAADFASGRGMGMSVVREVVEELGGELALETRVGHGTRFMIQLPLTLSIADALIVVAGGQIFAVPQASVREVIEVAGGAIHEFENNEILHYRETAIPFVRLPVFFGMREPHGPRAVLIVGEGRNLIGIGVDRVLGLKEVVVRPLIDPLVRVPGIGGATELGDGRVVLILDVLTFTRGARKLSRGVSGGFDPGPASIPPALAGV
jgi:two-component system, chemotaxis family, sensor kinase CheA